MFFRSRGSSRPLTGTDSELLFDGLSAMRASRRQASSLFLRAMSLILPSRSRIFWISGDVKINTPPCSGAGAQAVLTSSTAIGRMKAENLSWPMCWSWHSLLAQHRVSRCISSVQLSAPRKIPCESGGWTGRIGRRISLPALMFTRKHIGQALIQKITSFWTAACQQQTVCRCPDMVRETPGLSRERRRRL